MKREIDYYHSIDCGFKKKLKLLIKTMQVIY